MSKSNILRSDTSATHFAEMCTKAGTVDPTFARLKYLTSREVKAMATDELTWEFTERTHGDYMTYRTRGWAETTPRGVRKFYVRTERVG